MGVFLASVIAQNKLDLTISHYSKNIIARNADEGLGIAYTFIKELCPVDKFAYHSATVGEILKHELEHLTVAARTSGEIPLGSAE